MKVYEIFNWLGATAWLLSAICLSIIGLKLTAWFGSQRSLFSSWDSNDIKSLKASGLLFLIGVMFFVLGAVQ